MMVLEDFMSSVLENGCRSELHNRASVYNIDVPGDLRLFAAPQSTMPRANSRQHLAMQFASTPALCGPFYERIFT